MNSIVTLQGILLFWAFVSRSLLVFLRNRYREAPLRVGGPSVSTSACKILGAVIVEQSSNTPVEDGWEFVPAIEYTFPEDPTLTRYGLESTPSGMSLIQAHQFLSRWLPEGTPFDLKPLHTKYQKTDPDRSGPLELYLTIEEMDYFRNIQWKPQGQPVLSIRHLQGDFRTNEMNTLSRYEGSLASRISISLGLMAAMGAVLGGALGMPMPGRHIPLFLLELGAVAAGFYLWRPGRPEPDMSPRHKPTFRIDGESIGNLLK